jgi:hypothetical protein
MLHLLRDVWYWIRCHTYTRYHILDLSRSPYGYKWGWLDRPEAMLIANFQLLTDYVDLERPFKYHYRPDDPPPTLEDARESIGLKPDDGRYDDSAKQSLEMLTQQHNVGIEIRALYNWWNTDRKKQHDYLESLPKDIAMGFDKESNAKREADPKWHEYCRLTEELEARDEEMLQRLMKIRGHLWT